MEEHPVIEREHTRVHEENKTEAGIDCRMDGDLFVQILNDKL